MAVIQLQWQITTDDTLPDCPSEDRSTSVAANDFKNAPQHSDCQQNTTLYKESVWVQCDSNSKEAHTESGSLTRAERSLTVNEPNEGVHVRLPAQEGLYRCIDCDFTCATATSFIQHYQHHISKSTLLRINRGYSCTFKCKICDSTFDGKFALHKHLKSHYTRNTCHMCDYNCKDKKSLWCHMLSHTVENPFMCEFCNYRTRRKGNLKIHFYIHTTKKRFKYDSGSYKSLQPNVLERHPRTHTEKAHLKCDDCDWKFSSARSLKRHLLLHTREKRFKCAMCDKAFVSMSHLKRHILTHRGIFSSYIDGMRFLCQYCDKAFYSNSSFEAHVRTHTGEKPFHCEICNVNFNRKLQLTQHRKIHHAPNKGSSNGKISRR